MKIVWASHSSNVGGAELCFLEGAKGLVQAGHSVHALFPSTGDLVELVKGVGPSVSVIRYFSWAHTGRLTRPGYYQARRLAPHARSVAAIRRILEQQRPDVVVTNTMAISAPALAAKWAGCPHVWYLHEFGQEDHGAVYDYGDRLSYWLMDRTSSQIIVNSRAVLKKYTHHISSKKLTLVRYAVELRGLPDAHRMHEEQLKLVLVGELSPAKRQEDAVLATSLLTRQGLNAHLTLVGGEKPPYGDTVRDLIRELAMENSVTLVPFTKHPLDLVASSDIALICSKSEAFGRVTVEAMKLGKPVIGADSGATPELIRDGWNGLLYKVGDPVDLATKVTWLHGNRQRIRDMGQNAKQWANCTFTMERYVSGLVHAFEGARHAHRSSR